MSFATILPLIFGLSFQTPLVMLFLERINIFTIDDFRAKRKMAILVITIAAAVLTPGQDPFSMLLLADPDDLALRAGHPDDWQQHRAQPVRAERPLIDCHGGCEEVLSDGCRRRWSGKSLSWSVPGRVIRGS